MTVPDADAKTATLPLGARFQADGKAASAKTSFVTEFAEIVSDGRAGRRHGLRLDLCGLLNMGKYIHIPAVGSLDIELVLAPATDCVNAIAAEVPTFTVTNPYLTVDTIDMSGMYLGALDKVLSTGGLVMDYETFTTFTTNIGRATGTQQVRVLRNFSSLKSIYFWLFPTAKVAYCHNYTHAATKGTLTSYNVLIDGRPVLSHAIDVGAESVAEMRKSLRMHGDVSQDTQLTVFNATRRTIDSVANYNSGPHVTVMGVDLEKSSLLSGRPVSEIQVELTMSADPGQDMTCIVACHYDKRIVLQSGKVMTEIQ